MHPWILDGRRVPNGFWDDIDNRLNYLRWLGKHLGYTNTEDWYQIRHSDFVRNKGDALYRHVYNNDRLAIVRELHPDYDWKPWLFERMPSNTWAVQSTRREYFDWISEQEGFESIDFWYKMRRVDFEKYPGGRMLNNLYGGSPRRAITDIYPEYDWKPWKFVNSPPNFWKDDDNCREFIEWLAHELGYEEYEDWYQLDQRLLQDNYGAGMHKRFSGSPRRMLSHFYPEYDWKAWLFSRAGDNFWDSQDNRISYIEWLGQELGFTEIDDWYSIKQSDFENHRGTGILSGRYNSSPSDAVIDCFPNHDWKPWKFTITPNGFWGSREGLVQYMDWLGDRLGFNRPEDWYQIEGADFEYGTGLLLHHYDGSPSKVVMDYLPEYDWKEWLFGKAPNHFWKEEQNRRKYLDWLGENLGFEKAEDWYRVTKEDIVDNYGHGIIPHCGTLLSMLEEHFPSFNWLPWLMEPAPHGFWDRKKNQLKYMDWLGDNLDVKSLDDWYGFGNDVFAQNQGLGLLNNHGNSISRLLKDLYPEHDWKEWLFASTPHDFWELPINRRRYIDWLGRKLKFKEPEDWYNLTRDDLNRNHGSSMLANRGFSHSDAVIEHFPDFDWDESRFKRIGKNERRLLNFVQTIFPEEIIHSQYKHDELRFSDSNYKMELDIWIPGMNLAFEYQGEQHFEEFWRGVADSDEYRSLEAVQRRDREKRDACQEAGITLIEISYKWDRSEEYVRKQIASELSRESMP